MRHGRIAPPRVESALWRRGRARAARKGSVSRLFVSVDSVVSVARVSHGRRPGARASRPRSPPRPQQGREHGATQSGRSGRHVRSAALSAPGRERRWAGFESPAPDASPGGAGVSPADSVRAAPGGAGVSPADSAPTANLTSPRPLCYPLPKPANHQTSALRADAALPPPTAERASLT